MSHFCLMVVRIVVNQIIKPFLVEFHIILNISKHTKLNLRESNLFLFFFLSFNLPWMVFRPGVNKLFPRRLVKDET